MAAGRGGRRQGQPRPIPLQDRRRRRDRRYQPIYRENPLRQLFSRSASRPGLRLRTGVRLWRVRAGRTVAPRRRSLCAGARLDRAARPVFQLPQRFRDPHPAPVPWRAHFPELSDRTGRPALPERQRALRLRRIALPVLPVHAAVHRLQPVGRQRLRGTVGAADALGLQRVQPAARAALRAAAGAGRDRPARLPGARRLPARGPARRRPARLPAKRRRRHALLRAAGRWPLRRADGAGALSRQRQPGRSRAGPGRPGQQWPAGAAGIGRQRHGLLPAWRRWRLERPPAVRRHPHPVRRQPGRDGGPERRRQGRPAVHGRHRAAPLSLAWRRRLRAGAQRAAPRRLSRRHGEHRADQRGLRRRVRRRTVAPCAGPQRRSGRGPAWATAATASAGCWPARRSSAPRCPRPASISPTWTAPAPPTSSTPPSTICWCSATKAATAIRRRCACRCRCACRPPTRSRSPTSAATARPPS